MSKRDNEQDIHRKIESIVSYLYKEFGELEPGSYEFPLMISIDSERRIYEIAVTKPQKNIDIKSGFGIRIIFGHAEI